MAGFMTERTGIRLFAVRGIDIILDYSWFIIFALVLVSLSAGYFPTVFPGQPLQTYWMAGLLATLLFFLSVILHELSHSFMALRAGMQIREIRLFIFGGMARISEEAADPKTEFKIAVVGPLASFALAIIFWLILLGLRDFQPWIFVEIFRYLAFINVALGVFNLIPGFPLDGGRIFRAFWWWKKGSMVDATRLASDWGKGFAIALMIFGAIQIFAGALVGGIWLIFIGMFMRGIAEASFQDVMMRKSLEGTRAEDIMVRDIVTAPADLPGNRALADYFLRYGFRGFPVTSNGHVRGVISISHIKNVPESEHAAKKVAEVMVPLDSEMVIGPDTSLSEALQKMSEKNLDRLLVMRGDEMVGMITETGLLRFVEIKRTLTG
jgi:Zn-dependent protease